MYRTFLGSIVLALAAAGQCPTDGVQYRKDTESTMQGTISKVLRDSADRMPHTHVWLETKTGEFAVCLGPSAFVREFPVALRVGDPIQITGSKVTVERTDQVLARELQENRATIELRDEQGNPLWSQESARK